MNDLKISLVDYENSMPTGEIRAVIDSISVPDGGKICLTYHLTLKLPGQNKSVFINVFENQVHDLLVNLYDTYNIPAESSLDLEKHVGTEVTICVHTQMSAKGKTYYVLDGYKPFK